MLRNASDTLSNALERANHDTDTVDMGNRFIIRTELEGLCRVAGDDPFITTVLTSIPPQAVGGAGIQSEAALRERFSRVKRVCSRVAMVPEEGGGLGLHALSYMQSLLTIRAWLPKRYLDRDPSELHTYDLLDLASMRIKKGDLEGAVHYLNYLQGEPRNVARDWLADARLYLETRQAVELVQAYMFANSAVTSQNQ